MAETRSPADVPMSDKRRDEQSPVKANNEAPEGEDEAAAHKVFVGGISRNTDENELFSIFRRYSPKEVMIMRELGTHRPRGFGFITFATQKDMEWAIADMHNTRIDGRLVTVSKARPFERPRGDRSPHRSGSPERRPYQRREGDFTRDFPRRYTNYHHDQEGGQRPHHDNRRRPYDQQMRPRRYPRDDGPPYHGYPPNNYDNRNERGDYGGDYDGRRGGHRFPGPRNEDYHHRGEGNRPGGQWMDYDRRQQMRDREEGHRRWNHSDRDRRHYNNNGNAYNGGREHTQRWRSPEMEDRRRDAPHADSRGGDPDNMRGGNYGPVRRRSEVRRPEPYRHRSRSPAERRGR